MPTRRLALAFAATALLACDDPADPCAWPTNCPLEPADLVVSSATVRAEKRDADTGYPVLPPGDITVRAVINNAGAGAARATVINVELAGRAIGVAQIPPMTAGATHAVDIIAKPGFGRFLIDSDIAQLDVIVVLLDDDMTNNARMTEPFHIALPTLRARTTLETTRLTANASAGATVSIENVSRHAALPVSTLGFCIHDLAAQCAEADGATTLGRIALPAIGAGQSVDISAAIVVPSTATHQNQVGAYHLSTCIGDAGLPARDLLDPRFRLCPPADLVFVRPDYEACAPPLLQPGQPISAIPVCVRPCPVNVFAVNVQPGNTYIVADATGEEDKTLRWRTRYRDDVVDTSIEAGLQPATAGTVYAVTAPKFCASASISYEVVLHRR